MSINGQETKGATKRMEAIILGSGTSTGVPPIGYEDPDFPFDDPKNNRMRAGFLLREVGKTPKTAQSIIIDCGPDYRMQALRHQINRLDAVLLTHTHFDHIGGLDDLRLYNFRQGHALPVYGKIETLLDVKLRYAYIFNPPNEGGGVASFDMYEVGEVPFTVADLRVVPLPIYHGSQRILGFRFGELAFITDASRIEDSTFELVAGCRVLVLNALRPQPHSTHFNLEEAVEAARRVGAEQTYFIHMTHLLEHHSTNAKLPKGMELSYDGLRFEVDVELA
jgi:phosphoribosyl 1,2-cyclic phosphate phosphodiesterase